MQLFKSRFGPIFVITQWAVIREAQKEMFETLLLHIWVGKHIFLSCDHR